MAKYTIMVSQNGWEYTGYVEIICKELKQIDKYTVKADNVKIVFDEEIIIEENAT